MGNLLKRGTHRRQGVIRSHTLIVIPGIQHQVFGIRHLEEAAGHRKRMKKWEEALGSIRVGTKELQEIPAEGHTPG